MLVLSRRQQESIQICGNIVVTVLDIQSNTVRIGIDAPREIPVLRTELESRISDSTRHCSRSETEVNVLDNLRRPPGSGDKRRADE